MIPVRFPPGEEDTARVISGAAQDALRLVAERWGLPAPVGCELHVMTSCIGFIFRAAPWPWWILLAITTPLWVGRARRAWPVSAGWTLRFGRRTAVGVKPRMEDEEFRSA